MSFAHFQIEFHLVCFLKFVNDLRKTRIYCPPPHALIGQLLCAPQPVIGPEPLVHLDAPPTNRAPSWGHFLSVLISVKLIHIVP